MTQPPPDIERPSVLVVEDDANQRQLLHRILKERWDVFFASDVAEADRQLLLHPDICVLLCDYDLPGENGLEFCKRLQARNHRAVRVLVTGHTRVDLLMEAINSSCLHRFLEKPFQAHALEECSQEALEEFSRKEQLLRRQLTAEAELEQTAPRRRISHVLQIIFGVGSFALATAVIVLLVTLLLGALVFTLLYILKSGLGIDLFADRHLEDFLPFLK